MKCLDRNQTVYSDSPRRGFPHSHSEIKLMLVSVWFIQVDALQGHRVIDVACGSGDAQTLCLTDDDMVWSWGDGDYGKLGRGGSDGCKIPMKVRQFTQQSALEVSRGITFYFSLLLFHTGREQGRPKTTS